MAEAALQGATAARRVERFYVWMAGVCVACAFGFFALTYWGPLSVGRYHAAPIMHLHAVVFSAWPLLLLFQTISAADRRMDRHKAFGVAGVALATAMLFLGLWTTVHTVLMQSAAGHGPAARAFAIVPVSGILFFEGLVIAALVNVRRPDWHKRLMLVATASILQAAVARAFFILTRASPDLISPADAAPAPVALSIIPGMIVNLIIVAGMVYDWRTRGRVHAAYLIGGAMVVAVQVLRAPLSETPAWLATIDWLVAFAKG